MLAFSARRTILAVAYVLASASALAAQTPRTTFANPIDIDYRFMPSGVSRREAADPLITLFGDDYYLFASKSGGYWYSPDMRDWKLVVPEGYPIEDYAPSVVTIGGRMYYTAHKSKAVFTTDDPKAGKWRKIADIGEYADPAFFLDDEARDTFPRLIAEGEAVIVPVGALQAAIARLPVRSSAAWPDGPSIEDTLRQIDRLSGDYRRVCSEAAPAASA